MTMLKQSFYLLLSLMFYSTASHAAPVLLWSEDFESVTNTTPNSVVYDNSTAAFVALDNTASINKLEKALAIATFQSRKVVC